MLILASTLKYTHRKCAQQHKRRSTHCSTHGKVLMVKLWWYVPIIANLCPLCPRGMLPKRFTGQLSHRIIVNKKIRPFVIPLIWKESVFVYLTILRLIHDLSDSQTYSCFCLFKTQLLSLRCCYYLDCVPYREKYFIHPLDPNTLSQNHLYTELKYAFTVSQNTVRLTNSWASTQHPTGADRAADRQSYLILLPPQLYNIKRLSVVQCV